MSGWKEDTTPIDHVPLMLGTELDLRLIKDDGASGLGTALPDAENLTGRKGGRGSGIDGVAFWGTPHPHRGVHSWMFGESCRTDRRGTRTREKAAGRESWSEGGVRTSLLLQSQGACGLSGGGEEAREEGEKTEEAGRDGRLLMRHLTRK